MKAKYVFFSFVLLFLVMTGNALGGHEDVDNTIFGLNAGRVDSGNHSSTFIGSEAGYSNIAGTQNTFVGYRAGKANTSNGVGNTFFGYTAGLKNNDGDYNVYLGTQSGYSNVSGNYNTCAGLMSCFSGTNVSEITALGMYAGRNNLTGSENTFVGYLTGSANTTGARNTFLGYNTGGLNINGAANSFFGANVGRSNTSGSNNILLGSYSGASNTSGNQNTFVGSYAGYTNVTGVGNVFIGHKAGYNETTSNKLYIDNSDTATPLIYGDFSNFTVTVNGSLGIGRNPEYLLHAANGAWSDGAGWHNGSSREYKDNIRTLSRQEAFSALEGLTPVTFVYKANRAEQHVGFIAEDVPQIVAAKGRKGLSSMDIAAVLTRVAREQKATIEEQRKIMAVHSEKIAELERRVQEK